ncbi:carboxypeptidase [Alkalilimnicola ehrlichii]|uniref:M20 family metallopeptidase n=1 Tax=Alkalilimnicola ehrlichii TaxID=351052 RepID=UPI000E2FDEBA|nr:M20 family metallopeptidase [Alkalilimnicola ehrlichii]RFA29248.1 carboxypeptidase [Alkalilimnicola ehrlichii]
MTALLGDLVRLESPSLEPERQMPVCERLRQAFETVGMRCRYLSGRTSGCQLLAMPTKARKPRRWQLLLGHMDTVWPVGTLADNPFREEDGILRGPGVYDMKAGLVQMLFALKVLGEKGLRPALTPVVFINSDEEIGSHDSTRQITRLARGAERAFVLEPSLGREGRLKTRRKGVGRFEIAVRGRAAHAGLDPEQGVSAILELSYVIQQLFALNDASSGTTVNVGQVDGGIRSNVIAPLSRAVVDVRVRTQADAERVEAAIYSLRPRDPACQIDISGRIGRLPLEPTPRNRQLTTAAQHVARDLGFELKEGEAGGGSDGNTTSLYTATLDGMGAVGDGAHAAHEFVFASRMAERTALLALLLLLQT